MKYRKKPVVIEAIQLLWHTWSDMCNFAGVGKIDDGNPEGVSENPATGKKHPVDAVGPGMVIPTLEGVMYAAPGDWIIRGIKGELYPCKPDIFEATYEEAESEN